MSMLGDLRVLTPVCITSGRLADNIYVPGDKSITHRAIMFSSIAKGTSYIRTTVLGRDNFATIRIFQQLGVEITLRLHQRMYELALSEGIRNVELVDTSLCEIIIEGKGFSSLRPPEAELDCGNSGTTARLLCGLFSALPFEVTLVGDESLSQRPFSRVTKPLSEMGAQFRSLSHGKEGEVLLPLVIKGAKLNGITFNSPKSTAQVKSALVLAGLHAEGDTTITEPYVSRNHTEVMLSEMGVTVRSSVDTDTAMATTVVSPILTELCPLSIDIPGDISAAMFFIVAALINPQGEQKVYIRNVGINETRSACLDILRRMGADIELCSQRTHCGELVADLLVTPSNLKGVAIDKRDVAFAVDEIPILSVAASFSEGETVISGAEELRVKESDRLAMTALLLKAYGVAVEEKPDGLVIQGGGHQRNLSGVELGWKACGDHRISMCGAIMEYLLGVEMKIYDMKSIETSFPSFLESFR